jgi:muramoyltetrapeptide carboxypeptidase
MKRRDFICLTAVLPLFTNGLFANKNKIKNNVINKPKAIKKGSKIGIVAPGSAVSSPADIQKAEEVLNYFGFVPVWGKNVSSGSGYKTRSSRERLSDFNGFIRDNEIDAIMAVRGGYGSAYLLQGLDYKALAANPKLIIGYSDITAILMAVYKKSGIVGLHGPVLLSDFDELTTDCFSKMISGNATNFILQNPESKDGLRTTNRCRTITPGKATGKLIGGNLSMICSLMGTPYEPDTTDHILFLEDVGEAPYRIDRMLMQLKMGGKFEKVKAIVWGRCNDCLPGDSRGTWDSDLDEVLDRILGQLKVPCFSGLLFGHTDSQFTLPIGIEAELYADTHTIKILEEAVVL